MSIDFEGLAGNLLARGPSLLQSWLPGGKLRGTEFVCGNLSGEPGESLSINVQTGVWAEFSGDDKGSDLISLYAAINHMTQGDAAKALIAANGFHPAPLLKPAPAGRKPVVIEQAADRPPADAPEPGPHFRHGAHSALYAYRDKDGLLGYVARYDLEDGKQFAPWRWLDGKWQAKGLPKPRPLYGLERLQETPAASVLVVEGEKCVDAARDVMRPMCVVCWAGGASAIATANWEPLRGRKVALWPDNDAPGRKAMGDLAVALTGMGALVKIVNPEGLPEGHDVADMVAEGWTKKRIMDWIQRDGGQYLVPFKMPAPEAQPASLTPETAAAFPLSEAQSAGAEPPAAAITLDGLQLPPELRGLKGLEARRIWSALGLDQSTHNGIPLANEDTISRILDRFKGFFWYDDFLKKAMTSLGNRGPRPLDDVDYTRLLIWIQSEVCLGKSSKKTVANALDLHIWQHQRNCALEWMQQLTWDGTPRLEQLLPKGFGTSDNEYHRKVGRNFIMQMVHRVMEPGCQADYMPVFEGGQGKYKSSALRILGHEWFTESHEDFTKKDFLQLLPGKMLIEISELASFTKAEIEKIKGIITNRVDSYRASYGHFTKDNPRMCVFAGTTNRDDWNQDETGARRFWRVLTGNIDLAWIREHRDQLIAEARTYVEAGQEHYIVPETEAKRLQDDARDSDPWAEKILRWCEGKTGIRPEDIMTLCLDVPTAHQDKKAANRIRNILRTAGWVSASTRMKGTVVKAWRPPSIGDEPELPGMDEF